MFWCGYEEQTGRSREMGMVGSCLGLMVLCGEGVCVRVGLSVLVDHTVT